MDQAAYVSLNGIKIKEDKPVFNTANRAFRYGDALFETIRCMHQKPAYFQDHYQRLINGMSLLKMDIKSLPPANILSEQISSLIQKNKLFGDVRVRLTVFREDGGLYTPSSNKVNCLIETSHLNSSSYQLNSKGLLIDIFDDEQKAMSRISLYKTANSLLFILAGIYKTEQKKDDVLICNAKHELIEGLASNLFWIKDNTVYTPLRSSGCVDGVMRKQVIRILRSNRIPILEVGGANFETLLAADEIFLSNAIQGIQWVVGLKDKRYFCNMSKKISRLLHEDITNYMMDSLEN